MVSGLMFFLRGLRRAMERRQEGEKIVNRRNLIKMQRRLSRLYTSFTSHPNEPKNKLIYIYTVNIKAPDRYHHQP